MVETLINARNRRSCKLKYKLFNLNRQSTYQATPIKISYRNFHKWHTYSLFSYQPYYDVIDNQRAICFFPQHKSADDDRSE